MASIKHHDDGQWRARYHNPENREHTRHFATKRAAEEWLDSVRGDLVRGEWVDPQARQDDVR